MSNPSWCNNGEECNLLYTYCYNYECCKHCNIEEYRFNNDEGYRLKIFEKALSYACETIDDRGCTIGMACSKNNCELYAPCCNEITWKEYFLKKAREKND